MKTNRRSVLATVIVALMIGGMVGVVRKGRLSGRAEGGAVPPGCGGPAVEDPAVGAVGSLSSAISTTPIYFTNVKSGLNADVYYNGTSPGTRLQQYTVNTTTAQQFYLTSMGNGYYELIGTNSSLCIDVLYNNTADNTNVQLWTCNGSGAQLWKFVSKGSGRYNIVGSTSGKCLDVLNSSTSAGAQLVINTCSSSTTQQWTLSPTVVSASNVTANLQSFTTSSPFLGTISVEAALGSYTFTDLVGLSDSAYTSYTWVRSSDSLGTDFFVIDNVQNHTIVAADANQYLKFCVTPSDGTFSGTQVCSSYISVGSLVKADVTAGISISQVNGAWVGVAKGTYTFADYTGGKDKSSSAWYRASDSSGTGSTQVDTAATHLLTRDDANTWLRFCVTPSDGTYTGTVTCTSWLSVGPLLILYRNTGYGSDSLAIPFAQVLTQAACVNLSTYGWSNYARSLILSASSTSTTKAALYNATNCGSGVTSYWTASNGATTSSSDLGTTQNALVQSIRIASGDIPVASNVAFTWTNFSVKGTYTYYDLTGLAEGSSTLTWYRGTGSSTGTVIQTTSGTSSSTYNLVPDDRWGYLRFCVTPGNALGFSGSEVCSSWTAVGPVLQVYADAGFGGSVGVFAYEHFSSGNCIKLSDVGMNTAISSFILYAPTTKSATVRFSPGENCGSQDISFDLSCWYEHSYEAPKNTYYDYSYVGNSCNDDYQSLKVTW